MVRQLDDRWTVAQVLDHMMPNVVSCAFSDARLTEPAPPSQPLSLDRLISLVSVTREKLDSGEWRVVDHAAPVVERKQWPNEEFRPMGWIGAKIYDAALAEEFLNAFHGLAPWDDWKDPEYLDRLLISPAKKPRTLLYKRTH